MCVCACVCMWVGDRVCVAIYPPDTHALVVASIDVT